MGREAGRKESTTEQLPGFETAYANNNPGSRGQGLVMAQELGAKLVNMENLYVFETVEPDNIQNSVPYDLIYRGVIFINKEGERFTNECNEDTYQIAEDTLAQTDATIYAVFNDLIFQEFLAGRDELDLYDTLYLEGLEKSRHLVKADTLDTLAEQIGVPGAAFVATVENIPNNSLGNEYLLDAVDSWKSGPYYAIPETAAIGNTLGGLVVDTKAQVYDTEDQVIDGLFAAGEVAGNTMVSDFYYGLSDAVLMGKQAGIESVAYVSRVTGITEHTNVGTGDDNSESQSIQGSYTDGTYEGAGNGLNGEIRVNVTVSNGNITDIEVIETNETETLFAGVVDTVIPAIISSQGLEVDTVTGATFASNGLIEAVANALEGQVH